MNVTTFSVVFGLMSNTDDLNQMEKLKFKSFNLSNWKWSPTVLTCLA